MKTLAILAGVINFKKQFSHIHLSKMANLTFRAITLNQVWVSEITYIPLANGKWLYLAVWVDLWSRRVAGWCLADHMRNELAITALRRALLGRGPAVGLILHSDRGGQYASKDFGKLLSGSYLQSMSRAGECYDNATAESFWSRLKAEVLESGVFLSLEDARAEIGDYIDNYYNVVRKHSSINYCSSNSHFAF